MGVGVSFYKKDKTNVTETGDVEHESASRRASRDHGAKSKTQGVLESGEELTGTRHPSRQDTDEEGAGDTVSLDKQLGPKSAVTETGQEEPMGPQEQHQKAGCLPSVSLA